MNSRRFTILSPKSVFEKLSTYESSARPPVAGVSRRLGARGRNPHQRPAPNQGARLTQTKSRTSASTVSIWAVSCQRVCQRLREALRHSLWSPSASAQFELTEVVYRSFGWRSRRRWTSRRKRRCRRSPRCCRILVSPGKSGGGPRRSTTRQRPTSAIAKMKSETPASTRRREPGGALPPARRSPPSCRPDQRLRCLHPRGPTGGRHAGLGAAGARQNRPLARPPEVPAPSRVTPSKRSLCLRREFAAAPPVSERYMMAEEEVCFHPNGYRDRPLLARGGRSSGL